jgi:hypothetical protein
MTTELASFKPQRHLRVALFFLGFYRFWVAVLHWLATILTPRGRCLFR